MRDGTINKCKDCCRNQAKLRHYEKSKNIDWLESERIRGREKYKRLGYSEIQKERNKKIPWKDKLKNINRNLKIKKGFEAHHWSYQDEYIFDVIVVDRKKHKKIHKFLLLDINSRMFKDLGGNLLNTKELHISYLKKMGVHL